MLTWHGFTSKKKDQATPKASLGLGEVKQFYTTKHLVHIPNGVLTVLELWFIVQNMISQFTSEPCVLNHKPCVLVDEHNSPTGETGITRSVFISDDYVIKFGSIGEAYLMIDEEDRKHFAEVVYVDINRKWMVQKRVDSVPNVTVCTENYKLIREMKEKYEIEDVSFVCRAHNWTLNVNGVPVIYDYDFNPCRHKY